MASRNRRPGAFRPRVSPWVGGLGCIRGESGHLAPRRPGLISARARRSGIRCGGLRQITWDERGGLWWACSERTTATTTTTSAAAVSAARHHRTPPHTRRLLCWPASHITARKKNGKYIYIFLHCRSEHHTHSTASFNT